MAMDISETRIAQVNVGIITVTFGGADVPLVDKESPIAFAFTETRKELRAAGSLSKLTEYVTREDLESITIPFLEAGIDVLTLGLGGVTGGGGPVVRASTSILLVTGLVGTFTAYAASAVGETTLEIHDEDTSKPAIQFNCMSDLTRSAGDQVWGFAAA